MTDVRPHLKLIRYNKSRLKMETNDVRLKTFIFDAFTVPNPHYRFQPHGKKTLCPISPVGTFLPGLSFDIISTAMQRMPGLVVDIEDSRGDIFPFSVKVEEDEVVDPENEKFVYRDYQLDGIIEALKWGRGKFELPTGSGKSLLIYGLILNMRKHVPKSVFSDKPVKALVLVPTLQLVPQMHKDFLEYGCPEDGVCSFSSFDHQTLKDNPSCPIIVSNRAWLEGHAEELPQDINVLLVDEVHQVASSGNQVSKYVASFPSPVKFGFTGTLPSDKMGLWNVTGLIGKTLVEKKAYEFQETGVLAETRIVAVRFNHMCKQPSPPDDVDDPLTRAKMLYPLEWNYIEGDEFCNRFMTSFVFHLPGNSIILFDHVEHGRILQKLMSEVAGDSRQVFLIDGSVPLDYREDVRRRMEEKSDCVLLANTSCFKMGINIKNINNIVFAFGSGKASTKIVQSIGRGLRKKQDKDRMVLVDFYHSFKYSLSHFGSRMDLYKEHYRQQNIIHRRVEVPFSKE